MAKLPTKEILIWPGKESLGLICQNCQAGIPLIGDDPKTLPQSFEVTCPVCVETRTYQSAAIQTLQAVRQH